VYSDRGAGGWSYSSNFTETMIIVDKKIPEEAKVKLAKYGILVELETDGIVYPAISGHPDIFFCKTPELLVVSPSLPEKYLNLLKEQHLQFIIGNQASLPVRQAGSIPAYPAGYPATVHYNAAINDHYLVHNLKYTDPVILQSCHTLKKIPVKQGYTRCNLTLLKDDHYITSDTGIQKELQRNGLDGILVSPEGIVLSGFPNGFIGGTLGVLNDRIFVIGSLFHYAEGGKVRAYLENLEYEIVELYEGPLFDGGSILFL